MLTADIPLQFLSSRSRHRNKDKANFQPWVTPTKSGNKQTGPREARSYFVIRSCLSFAVSVNLKQFANIR